jgi:23S rRNA (cytosine1962-C5)-methyltransferase
LAPAVVLTARGKKRFQQKHPWIFSNELQSKPDVAPGTIVEVRDEAGHHLGTGYYNNHTLIAVRILSYRGPFDLAARIRKAFDHRREIYAEPVYRLIYGAC